MLRGISHVHSTYSFDGKLPLEDVAALMRGNGLDFVLMTEHVETFDAAQMARFVDHCRELSTDDFLLLPGFELEDYNLLCLGVDAVDSWDEIHELIEPFRAQGAYLALSHPRKLHRFAEEWAYPVIEGVEVWNAKYDGRQTLRPSSLGLFHELAAERPGLVPLAGLDFHRASDWADVCMEVGAERPTRDDVLGALRDGRVRILAGGEPIPIYEESGAGARAVYRVKSAACIAALDAAYFTNLGLGKAGIPVPRGVKKFVKKLF